MPTAEHSPHALTELAFRRKPAMPAGHTTQQLMFAPFSGSIGRFRRAPAGAFREIEGLRFDRP
jgi:hypothetical protein